MGTVHAKSDQNNRAFPTPIETREIEIDKQQSNDINLEGLRARVDRVNIDGLSRTKDDIIEECVRELFRAKDFQDVLFKANRTKEKLEELGCFKNIGVFIDTSKGPQATPDGLEVTFNVKEFKRVTGGVSTHVGNNEGALLIGLRAPNLFGRGERVHAEYSHGSNKTSNFNIGFVKPFVGAYRPTFSTSIFQANSEWATSGYKLLERGFLLDFGFFSTAVIKHNIQWDGTIRDLKMFSKNSSFDVRKHAGLSLKSAVRHILSVDLRDDIIFPSSGSLFQLTSELAGIGGDVGFVKNSFYFQSNYSVLEDFVLQGSLTGGCLTSLHNDKKIGISDMFFIGGPLSVRGFETRGVGPHSDNDSLGALSYWSTGLNLFTPLPFRPAKGGFGELFRTHFFVNAGNALNLNQVTRENLLASLQANMRMSYGLGVALRLGSMARLEVNYCFPYSFDKGDRTHPGVQFGIGVQFL